MDEAKNLLGENLAENSQMYLGHHGHVLTFPIEKGKTMNGMSSPHFSSVVLTNTKWWLLQAQSHGTWMIGS